MIKFIDGILEKFRGCFSRTAAFHWFVIVILGFLTRTDFLGVTSFMRCFSFAPKAYDSMIKFFRSKAYDSQSVRNKWYSIIGSSAPLFRMNGKILLAGDGTKHPKEGSFMPGVKKLVQESADSSKPQHIFGHMFGGVAAVTEHESGHFAIPLKLDIQDGLRDTASWDGGCIYRSLTHVVQMICNGYEAARQLGDSCLVLDRYFLTVPALEKLKDLNASRHCLDIITRAKSSCVAYEPLEAASPAPAAKGRPRKKGAALKLTELFESRKDQFVRASAKMYGIRETVSYLCLDLLWGAKLYQKVRFVLVTSNKGNCILVSTDLTLDPVSIIEAYALRFKIECTFREFKQQIGGFCYHFWSKFMPKLKRYRKAGEPTELSFVQDGRERQLILDTIEATERFVLFAGIAMGIVQLMAQTPSIAKKAKAARYLRTESSKHVSEATVLDYIHKHFFRLLLRNPKSGLTQIIICFQKRYSDDGEADFAA